MAHIYLHLPLSSLRLTIIEQLSSYADEEIYTAVALQDGYPKVHFDFLAPKFVGPKFCTVPSQPWTRGPLVEGSLWLNGHYIERFIHIKSYRKKQIDE